MKGGSRSLQILPTGITQVLAPDVGRWFWFDPSDSIATKLATSNSGNCDHFARYTSIQNFDSPTDLGTGRKFSECQHAELARTGKRTQWGSRRPKCPGISSGSVRQISACAASGLWCSGRRYAATVGINHKNVYSHHTQPPRRGKRPKLG